MISRKSHLLLSLLVAVSILTSPIRIYASGLQSTPQSASVRAPPPVELDAPEVVAEVIKNESVTQVAAAVSSADPGATVLVERVKRQVRAKSKPKVEIELQRSNALNTLIIYFTFGWENGVYLISTLQPHGLRWWQAALMLGFNIWYLKKLSLPTGAWSKLMQRYAHPIVDKLMSYNVPEDKAEITGQLMAHAGLLFTIYAVMQILSTAPNLHAGIASTAALFNITRKTGVALFSGTGFALLRHRWDRLKDSQRLVSRQAFTAFDSVRKFVVTGIFGPFLILTANSTGVGHFLLDGVPYLISGGVGAVLYFRADRIAKRYPQAAAALERFEKATKRLNEKLSMCAKILRGA